MKARTVTSHPASLSELGEVDSGGKRAFGALLALWALAMISVPILRWLVHDPPIPTVMIVAVLLQVSTALAALIRGYPARRVLLMCAVVLPLAWLVEFIGLTTGFPFGSYQYSDRLQPYIGGVPLLIPLAWLMMLPSAWAVAALLTRRVVTPLRRSAFIGVSALAMTAWDLFLDPQMMSWGFWTWAEPGAYFGVPLTNFAGWLLASALITTAAHPPIAGLLRVSGPLLLIYGVTWLLESVGLAVFWGLPGPALSGFCGMGMFVLAATRAYLRAK